MIHPLIEAAKSGNSQKTRKWLEEGTHPDTPDHNGETALNWAAHLGHTSIVKDLLAAGANRESRGRLFYATPLFLAARGGHRGIVALLSALSDLDAQDDYGATPLMVAVERYEPVLKPPHRILRIVDILIEAGADLNIKDNNGDTALMWAVRWQNAEVVKRLVESGIDISATNNRGWTAVDLADARGNKDMVKLITTFS